MVPLKVNIELPATSRHNRAMTERLLKATLSPNQTNKQTVRAMEPISFESVGKCLNVSASLQACLGG